MAVITATKIKVPLISDVIAPNLSPIVAAAITKESVEVNRKPEAIKVLVSYQNFKKAPG